MSLRRGVVKSMLEEVRQIDGYIPCHETLDDEIQAVCRGQFETAKTSILQVAERLGAVIDWTRP